MSPLQDPRFSLRTVLMGDTRLNLSEKGTALFRAPEQGWLTGQVWAKTAHDSKQPTSSDEDVLPMGAGAIVNNINSYDLLFVYTNAPCLAVSNNGRHGRVGTRAAFASFNGMDVNRPCSFIGCATTGYIANSGVDAIVSITMSGVVTVDCTSYKAFQDGDLVAWQVPGYDTSKERNIMYPYNPKDDDIGRLRCVLFPVRNANPGAANRVAIGGIRRAMGAIKTYIARAAGAVSVHEAAIAKLKHFDRKSSVATHLEQVLEGSGAEGFLQPTLTNKTLASDLWASLEFLWRQGMPVPGKRGHLSKDTAFTMAALAYLAITSTVRKAMESTSKIIIHNEQGHPVTDAHERALIGTELDSNLLFSLIRFSGFMDNYYNHFRKHHIIGMCINPCPAGAVVKLDIWLGRT